MRQVRVWIRNLLFVATAGAAACDATDATDAEVTTDEHRAFINDPAVQDAFRGYAENRNDILFCPPSLQEIVARAADDTPFSVEGTWTTEFCFCLRGFDGSAQGLRVRRGPS